MVVDQIITTAKEYTNQYSGDYFDYYQIHIFSFNQIFSTYFNPDNISIEQLRLNAQNIIAVIQKNSENRNQGFLFENNGKFLITESVGITDHVELFEFNPEFVRYEQCYDFDDLFDFLGETKVETFIKNALTSVGAKELINVIEPQLNNLMQCQSNSNEYYNKIRESDKNSPKYLIEVYRIEKNYNTHLVQVIKSNDFESTLYLPEYRKAISDENRMGYKVKDIDTNKVVEDPLKEIIERIKFAKHLKENPPIMDLDELQKMEFEDENFDLR